MLFSVTFALSSCHRTTLEDQAENLAKEYTERYCPTPIKDMQRTDSMTFDRNTHTLSFYFTLTDQADNVDNMKLLQKKITKTLLDELKENTTFKVYKDAGYNFRYVFRSKSTNNILYEKNFSRKNYK